jgi:hypothetical protein
VDRAPRPSAVRAITRSAGVPESGAAAGRGFPDIPARSAPVQLKLGAPPAQVTTVPRCGAGLKGETSRAAHTRG